MTVDPDMPETVVDVVEVVVSEPVDGAVKVKRRRGPRGPYKPRAAKVVDLSIDPRIMVAARKLAGRDPSRIRLNRDGSVSVLNPQV